MAISNQTRLLVSLAVAVVIVIGLVAVLNLQKEESETIKIGYIGAMTGPVAKYGSHEAVSLAVEEINAKGGITGVPIELIAEDGKCNSTEAVNAVKKLIEVDDVKVILGGHCSPESVAIAPLVENAGVVMLASITTSPYLSDKGDYVFRTSPVNTNQIPFVIAAVRGNGHQKISIIYEQTDYAQPIAEALNEKFPEEGGQQQMLAIARALMQNTELLLLDEPSLGLAPKTMKDVFEKVLEINREGIAIIIVEQNAKQAVKIANRTYVLEDGKIALQGSKEILKDKARIKNIYFGGV